MHYQTHILMVRLKETDEESLYCDLNTVEARNLGYARKKFKKTLLWLAKDWVRVSYLNPKELKCFVSPWALAGSSTWPVWHLQHGQRCGTGCRCGSPPEPWPKTSRVWPCPAGRAPPAHTGSAGGKSGWSGCFLSKKSNQKNHSAFIP